MLPKRPWVRNTFSWLAVALGILLGVVGLVGFAKGWIEPDPASPVWMTSRFQAAGPGLLGLVFLIASFTALRNRRRAGLCFLAGAPISAFVLTYPDAGYLVTHADRGIYFHLPELGTAVVLACLFYAPFVLPLFAIRNRRRAVYLFLISAILAGLVFGFSQWTAALLPRLAGWSALFALFGGFWLGTHRLGWHALLAAPPGSLVRRLAAVLMECLFVAALALTGIFASTVMQSSLGGPDCSGGQLFVRPLSPGHAVFTARMIRVGHTAKVSGRWAGDWAVGIVRQQFWGLPAWTPRLVLLTNSIFWEDETFFVSGRCAKGHLTRFLPIVDAMACGSYFVRRLADATLELRLLREAPATGELRITGYVLSPKPPTQESNPSPASAPSGTGAARFPGETIREAYRTKPYEWELTAPKTHTPLASVRISVSGSSGTTIVTTDRDGIYEAAGLRPDNYTLRLLDLPANQTALDRKVAERDLIQMGRLRSDIYLAWDGSMEGRVRDVAGDPARVWMELRDPDGTLVSPDIAGRIQNYKDGSFHVDNLPPGGRYILLINPYGPNADSPYPRLYYPSATRIEDARTLEIGASKHLRNVDFALSRLTKREMRVRVAWPDGRPADYASVHVAYEHTDEYEAPVTSSYSWVTDGAGVANLYVFGDARIRVQAQKRIPEEDAEGPPRYSAVVELETAKLPPSLDLVVLSSPARSSR